MTDQTFVTAQTVNLHFGVMESVGAGDKTAVHCLGNDIAGIVFSNVNIIGVTDKPDGAALNVSVGVGADDFFQHFHCFFGGAALFQNHTAEQTGAQTVLAVVSFGKSIAGVHHHHHAPVIDTGGGIKRLSGTVADPGVLTGHSAALQAERTAAGVAVFVHNDLFAAGHIIHSDPAGTFVSRILLFGSFFNFFHPETQDAKVSTFFPTENPVDLFTFFDVVRSKTLHCRFEVAQTFGFQLRRNRPAFVAIADFGIDIVISGPIFTDVFFQINIFTHRADNGQTGSCNAQILCNHNSFLYLYYC